ncbi:MFS transporter [Pseudonocardia nigra]|uniref:MFS transporter n=1 Tax=Pseudonocardia nigra TaxID=1921578 RepID=UPI001C5E8A6E|nr:MFS transporter [Pseudonocardia nigra]
MPSAPPPSPGGPRPLRRLVVPVFLPAAVFGVGQGASAPVVALQARELGASIWVAGLIVALLGLGQVLGDLPAGQVVARIGERRAVLLGSAVGAVGVALSLFSWSPVVLGVGVALFGVASAVWGLARQSYVVDAVPPGMRARALSAMASLSRLGFLIGPFLGAGVVSLVGPRGGFVVQLVAVLVAGALMAAMPDVTARAPGAPQARSLRACVAAHRKVLGTLGAATMLMGAARASRTAVLPLWAEHIGLDPVTTSLLFGLGAALDVALSYPAGRWMDLRGRRSLAAASLVGFTAAHLVLPLAGGVVALGAVSALMGVANGLGNGLIMTIGTDAAPDDARAEFLGAWRLCHDLGMLGGPLLIGAVSGAATLGAAALVMGGLSAVGAGGMARWVPRRRAGQSSDSVPDSARPSAK